MSRGTVHRLRRLTGAALLGLLALGGCVVPAPIGTDVADPPVWPEPPLAPRIRWVGAIATASDAGIDGGLWRRLGDWVLGREQVRLVRPYGVLADRAGRIYVADNATGLLDVFDRPANRFLQLGKESENELVSPVGLALDEQDNIYLSDSHAGIVYRLAAGGAELRPWVSSGLVRPTGLVYHPQSGRLYVSDTLEHQVVAFDRQGREEFRFGGRGSVPGKFNFPTDLAIDNAGRLLVTDALNARVQIFSAAGAPVATFGEAGDVPGTMNKPKGVAVNSAGHIFVCDALLDRVQIFDERGQLLLAFGERGRDAGEFWMPSGIWIDERDRIYVVDTYNQRIQIFQYLPGPSLAQEKSL